MLPKDEFTTGLEKLVYFLHDSRWVVHSAHDLDRHDGIDAPLFDAGIS